VTGGSGMLGMIHVGSVLRLDERAAGNDCASYYGNRDDEDQGIAVLQFSILR
jgi:hypothetical protein